MPELAGDVSQILAEAGVPPGPVRHADTGLDSPDAVAATLRSAGAAAGASGRTDSARSGTGQRISGSRAAAAPAGSGSAFDAAARADVLARLRRGLDPLGPGDLLWEGEVICAVATM
jgi:hypothetical protein